MKVRVLAAASAMLGVMAISPSAFAQLDCTKVIKPSPWGKDDQTGATNRVTPAVIKAAAAEIQTLFLDGKRREAAMAVPDRLVDEISLVGPKERIRDRLQAWRETARQHKVQTLVLSQVRQEWLRPIMEAAS